MERDYRVLLIFLWLVGLTCFLIYDRIHTEVKPVPTIILETLEPEELEADYE